MITAKEANLKVQVKREELDLENRKTQEYIESMFHIESQVFEAIDKQHSSVNINYKLIPMNVRKVVLKDLSRLGYDLDSDPFNICLRISWEGV